MPTPKLSDADYIASLREVGAEGLHKKIGGSLRAIYARRRSLERKYGIRITPPIKPNLYPQVSELPGFINLTVKDGVVIVGGDSHIWPGPPSTAMRAFVKFIKTMKPAAVILNGDVMDFPSISRHPPIGWTKQPKPADELEAATDQLHEIAVAAGRARKIWPIGNHDERLETAIASKLPELAKVKGTRLSDHFPAWEACWACGINDDVVVKHIPQKGGVHSTRNSTLHAGKTTVSNHLHSQKVTPYSDYRGQRWGVDTGCLADVHHRAFLDYTRAAALDWRAGFAVLTFVGGVLLPPELVTVWTKDSVVWRGEIMKV
jgi:hypothetical protein